MGPKPHTLYITMQSAAAAQGENKYDWGLYITENQPPGGHLFTVNDLGNAPHKLYNEVRIVSDPIKSRDMAVCLMVHKSPGYNALARCSKAVPFKNGRPAPPETKWTCRVWVKQVLTMLHAEKQIMLSVSVDEIMKRCQALADEHKIAMSNNSKHRVAKVYNGTQWMLPPLQNSQANPHLMQQGPPTGNPPPGNVNPPTARRTDTGNLTLMDIDSPGTPTTRPSLITRTSLKNGAAPSSPATCSSPMDLDSPSSMTRKPNGSNPFPFGPNTANHVGQASTNNILGSNTTKPTAVDLIRYISEGKMPVSLAALSGTIAKSRLGATKPLTTCASGNGARPMPPSRHVEIPKTPGRNSRR